MAWNSNPKVRELGNYADKYGFSQAVLVGIKGDFFELISYGNNSRKCQDAKFLADSIYQEIANGEIEVRNENS